MKLRSFSLSASTGLLKNIPNFYSSNLKNEDYEDKLKYEDDLKNEDNHKTN